jgi:hypothetical protein
VAEADATALVSILPSGERGRQQVDDFRPDM